MVTLNELKPFLNVDVDQFDLRSTDKRMFNATEATVIKLNGCVGCNAHVYMPSDRNVRCPIVECQHPRFNNKRQPNEVSCNTCI